MEVWRSIPGFEGLYEVSSYGLVRSVDRIGHNPRYGDQRIRGRILKASLTKDGYWHLELRLRGVRMQFLVHRLVAIAFVDNPSAYEFVNHKDKDKRNNHFKNLEWCSHRENLTHSFLTRGTSKYPGVSWNNRRQKWVAFIKLDKKSKYLGGFENEIDAADAYRKALVDHSLVNKYAAA